MSDDIIKEEDSKRATHDMRDYFYKVVTKCIIEIKLAAIQRNLPMKRLMLDELVNVLFPDFTNEEQKEIESFMEKARETERSLQRYQIKSPAFTKMRQQQTEQLDNELRIAERKLYLLMEIHNMRLPKGSTDIMTDNQIDSLFD